MSDPDPLDGIAVLRSHLEEWERTLRWANGHFVAMDLSENYRQGRPNLKPAKLTTLTGQVLGRIEGYLNNEFSAE